MNAVTRHHQYRNRLCRQAVAAVALAALGSAVFVAIGSAQGLPMPVYPGDQTRIEQDFGMPGTVAPGRYYMDAGDGRSLPDVMPPDDTSATPAEWGRAECPPTYSPWLTRLGFRHSYTHGRNVGWGEPLVGSSWLNRPYYVGGSLGPMWMTRRVENSVGRDVDLIGTAFLGWDWDYYWGSEFEFAYATPELINSSAPNAHRGDRLVHWNYSLMYFPWGDSTIRPYWRAGVGDTKFDFPTDSGDRRDDWLLTFPVGIGVKYPMRRWLTARAELADQISWGANGIATQHILALTFGLECRFGAHPQSYWPWNPSRHIW